MTVKLFRMNEAGDKFLISVINRAFVLRLLAQRRNHSSITRRYA